MNYQKSLVALAVAGAIAAPQMANAEADLYGRVRTAINYNDDGTNDTWDTTGLTSRLGVKGSEDLGNGLEATYRYEFKVDSGQDNGFNDGSRIASVGLKGGFGHVRIGQMWNVIYNNIAFIDYLATASAAGYYANVSPATRSGDQLQYTLSFGKLSFAGAAVITDENDEDPANAEEIDRYDLGATYSGDRLTIGAALMSVQDQRVEDENVPGTFNLTEAYDVYGIGGTLDVIDGLQLGAIFTSTDQLRNGNDDDKNSFDLSVRWSPIDTWDFDGQVGMVEDFVVGTDGKTDDLESYMLSATKRLSKRTRLGAIWQTLTSDAQGTDDTDNLWLLIRHDF